MKNKQTKRLLILLLVSIFLFSCSKDDGVIDANTSNQQNFEVTLNEAQEIAAIFTKNAYITAYLNNQNNNLLLKNSTKENKIVDKINAIKGENAETLFYTISYKEGGFLILAGDKRSTPILAYSLNNLFPTETNEYPEGLKMWFDFAKDQIKYIKKNKLKSTLGIDKQWELVLKELNLDISLKIPPTNHPNCPDDEIVAPLLNTKWHQWCGYNDLMPVLTCGSCGHASAGCAPVAISQTMRYFEYPTNYNWSNMPNTIGSTTTAGLISDIWNSIPADKKEYDCDNGTGVYSSFNIADLLKNTFNYSSATKVDYTNVNLVLNNLRNNQPVIFMGTSSTTNESHMWVCDGFEITTSCMFDLDGNLIESETFTALNMNWGWGGPYNGFYSYNNFNSNNTVYNTDLKIIYNINP